MDFADVLLWMLAAATVWPAFDAARRAVSTKGPLEMAVFLSSLVVIVALALTAAASEKGWEQLAREDGPIEWATVFAFLLAAAWNAVVVRAAAPTRLDKLLVVGVALFCVFVAGEEISWGQRLLAFQPPEAFLENNYQQELNLHNVLMDDRALGFKLESKHIVAVVALVYGVVAPLVRQKVRVPFGALVFPTAVLAPAFLVVMAGELTYPVELSGEGAELVLGLLFLGTALIAAPPPRLPMRAALGALAAPLLLGAVTAPLLARVVFGDDEEGTRVAAEELARLRADVERGAQTKLQKKGTVHKRLFTASRDGYVALSGGTFLDGQDTPAERNTAHARRDRQGWFLDPWNNPYWILVERKEKRAVVYSFGPNRQRDTVVRARNEAAGDDILVVFPLDVSAASAEPRENAGADEHDKPASPEPGEQDDAAP